MEFCNRYVNDDCTLTVLDFCSRRDLRNLSLVNKHLFKLAAPLNYHTVGMAHDNSRKAMRIAKSPRAHLVKHVQYIINDWTWTDYNTLKPSSQELPVPIQWNQSVPDDLKEIEKEVGYNMARKFQSARLNPGSALVLRSLKQCFPNLEAFDFLVDPKQPHACKVSYLKCIYRGLEQEELAVRLIQLVEGSLQNLSCSAGAFVKLKLSCMPDYTLPVFASLEWKKLLAHLESLDLEFADGKRYLRPTLLPDVRDTSIEHRNLTFLDSLRQVGRIIGFTRNEHDPRPQNFNLTDVGSMQLPLPGVLLTNLTKLQLRGCEVLGGGERPNRVLLDAPFDSLPAWRDELNIMWNNVIIPHLEDFSLTAAPVNHKLIAFLIKHVTLKRILLKNCLAEQRKSWGHLFRMLLGSASNRLIEFHANSLDVEYDVIDSVNLKRHRRWVHVRRGVVPPWIYVAYRRDVRSDFEWDTFPACRLLHNRGPTAIYVDELNPGDEPDLSVCQAYENLLQMVKGNQPVVFPH